MANAARLGAARQILRVRRQVIRGSRHAQQHAELAYHAGALRSAAGGRSVAAAALETTAAGCRRAGRASRRHAPCRRRGAAEQGASGFADRVVALRDRPRSTQSRRRPWNARSGACAACAADRRRSAGVRRGWPPSARRSARRAQRAQASAGLTAVGSIQKKNCTATGRNHGCCGTKERRPVRGAVHEKAADQARTQKTTRSPGAAPDGETGLAPRCSAATALPHTNSLQNSMFQRCRLPCE